jgi:hypothetical protein
VYLGPKVLGRRSSVLAPDRLAGEFRVLARVANDGGSVVNELDAFNGIIVDKGTDGVGCNVAEATVESVDVDLLDCAAISTVDRVSVFDFVEAVCTGRDVAYEFARPSFDLAGIVLECDRAASPSDAANRDYSERHVRRVKGVLE